MIPNPVAASKTVSLNSVISTPESKSNLVPEEAGTPCSIKNPQLIP